MAHLVLDNVSKNFGGLAAVSDLNMEINDREIVGLIGPNGAGKTTTFNLITGELKPSSGEISFESKKLNGMRPHRVAKAGISRTYQLTTLFPGYTVMENVLVGFHLETKFSFVEALLNLRSNRRKERRLFDRAMEVLDFMGLSKLVDEQAENLPHGLQRKLGVAISLACGPRLLLLDEPLTGMNPTEAADMINTIRQINERYGTAILIVEHNLKAVMALCRRIVVINFGMKIAQGSPEEIQNDEQVIEAYIGRQIDAS